VWTFSPMLSEVPLEQTLRLYNNSLPYMSLRKNHTYASNLLNLPLEYFCIYANELLLHWFYCRTWWGCDNSSISLYFSSPGPILKWSQASEWFLRVREWGGSVLDVFETIERGVQTSCTDVSEASWTFISTPPNKNHNNQI
jgi:hypothetical protein